MFQSFFILFYHSYKPSLISLENIRYSIQTSDRDYIYNLVIGIHLVTICDVIISVIYILRVYKYINFVTYYINKIKFLLLCTQILFECACDCYWYHFYRLGKINDIFLFCIFSIMRIYIYKQTYNIYNNITSTTCKTAEQMLYINIYIYIF